MRNDRKVDVFLALLKAGLWEQSVNLLPFGNIDFVALEQLAKEQSVVGLVAAGLGQVNDIKLTKPMVIPFVGKALHTEQKNKAMNGYIASLFERLGKNGIQTVLVKGQGVAQCYIKPLWRECGDIDLLLDEENYVRCKDYLLAKASSAEAEDTVRRHLGMTIDDWVVELHGSLRTRHLFDMDEVIAHVQEKMFVEQRFRKWRYNDVDILLPNPNDDVVFVFSHIIQHFYDGGIGLRQICDWCRLMWTYRKELDIVLLKDRITKMRMTTEWQTFATFAVNWLGMPPETMPLYNESGRIVHKAKRLLSFVIKSGNFGHNRDKSYLSNYSRFIRHQLLFALYTYDTFQRFLIFPSGSLRAWLAWIRKGFQMAVLGKR